MKFDIQGYLGAVTRSVSAREREGTPVRVVTLARSYDTPPDDLWDAVTNPERLPRWFLPISGDLKVGGHYQLEGNAGGTITECAAPRFLALTWEFGEGVSWLEVSIAAEGKARSRLTLAHICPIDESWHKYGPGAAGVGWDLGVLGLEAHLARAERFDDAAFSASPEGRDYVALTSEDWGRAALAAGETKAHAAAWAKRTTAFYLGEETEAG